MINGLKRKGLTLMELLLTISLLAVLSTFISHHMFTSWDAAEKNFGQIHAAVTAANIYEGLLAQMSDPATATNTASFLAALPMESETYLSADSKTLAKDSIYHAAGTGRLGVWKEDFPALGYNTIIVGEPLWRQEGMRVVFSLKYFVHNP